MADLRRMARHLIDAFAAAPQVYGTYQIGLARYGDTWHLSHSYRCDKLRYGPLKDRPADEQAKVGLAAFAGRQFTRLCRDCQRETDLPDLPAPMRPVADTIEITWVMSRQKKPTANTVLDWQAELVSLLEKLDAATEATAGDADVTAVLQKWTVAARDLLRQTRDRYSGDEVKDRTLQRIRDAYAGKNDPDYLFDDTPTLFGTTSSGYWNAFPRSVIDVFTIRAGEHSRVCLLPRYAADYLRDTQYGRKVELAPAVAVAGIDPETIDTAAALWQPGEPGPLRSLAGAVQAACDLATCTPDPVPA